MQSPVNGRLGTVPVQELIRCAIVWHEMWHEGLEEASKLYFGQQNIMGMLSTLAPLHAMMKKTETLHEVSFFQAYGRDLGEAHEWCKSYLKTKDEQDINQVHCPGRVLQREWGRRGTAGDFLGVGAGAGLISGWFFLLLPPSQILLQLLSLQPSPTPPSLLPTHPLVPRRLWRSTLFPSLPCLAQCQLRPPSPRNSGCYVWGSRVLNPGGRGSIEAPKTGAGGGAGIGF